MSLGQVGIVVARMGDQFPCAGGKMTEQCIRGGRVEGSGGQNADGAVGGAEALFRHDAAESGLKQPQQVDLGTANEMSGGCGAKTPRRLKGIANGANAGCLGRAQHRAQDGGKHMGVFVRVNVSEMQAAGLQQFDLSSGLGLNLNGADAALEEPLKKSAQLGMKAAGVRVHKRWEFLRGKHRLAIDQHYMAAYAQRWRGARQFNGFFCGGSFGHQRGAGQRSAPVEFDNGAIYPGGQSEVVGVENEAAHWLSVTTSAAFLWLREYDAKEIRGARIGRLREANPEAGREMVSEIAQRNTFLHEDGPPVDCPPVKQSAPKWFAVYTLPRHEKRVEQYLSVREIEHYLPLYHPRRRWSDGTTVTLDLPLFPGYIFVRIDRSERVRVLEVPGVLNVVGGPGRQPASLPEGEIEGLRSGLHLRRAEPHPLLTVGQRARIRTGALAGMEGVVVRQKGSLRVVLTVNLILQSVAVEVDGTELEAIDSVIPDSAKSCAAWPGLRTAQGSFSSNRRFAWS